MFWWVRVYTIHPSHVEDAPVLVCSNVHARQSFVDDLVRTYCSRSRYSHIQGVPIASVVITGHGQIVAPRTYRAYCCVVLGHGLAMVCWLEGIFSVRTRLCSVCARAGTMRCH